MISLLYGVHLSFAIYLLRLRVIGLLMKPVFNVYCLGIIHEIPQQFSFDIIKTISRHFIISKRMQC